MNNEKYELSNKNLEDFISYVSHVKYSYRPDFILITRNYIEVMNYHNKWHKELFSPSGLNILFNRGYF